MCNFDAVIVDEIPIGEIFTLNDPDLVVVSRHQLQTVSITDSCINDKIHDDIQAKTLAASDFVMLEIPIPRVVFRNQFHSNATFDDNCEQISPRPSSQASIRQSFSTRSVSLHHATSRNPVSECLDEICAASCRGIAGLLGCLCMFGFSGLIVYASMKASCAAPSGVGDTPRSWCSSL